MAGVHLYGSSLDTASLAFKSSAVGAIDGWNSLVLLVHGDDDRLGAGFTASRPAC
jgi:dipeptidyl-peptidase-4